MSSRAHSFNDISKASFPKKIVLDTNFVLNVTHRFTRHPKVNNVYDCNLFMKSLAHDESQIYIPNVVINEFCYHIYLNILSEYKKKHNVSKKEIDIYRSNPKLIYKGHSQISEAIKNLKIVCSEKQLKEGSINVRNKALNLMKKYNMLPADAFIGAIATFNQIYNIATLDVNFAKSMIKEKDVHIYIPDDLYIRYFN